MKRPQQVSWAVIGILAVLAGCSGGGDGGASASAPVAATGSVSFQWDPVADSDLAGYRIYQSTNAGSLGTLVKDNLPPSTTTYQATGLTKGQTYYFVVRALDTSGNESSSSNQISKLIP